MTDPPLQKPCPSIMTHTYSEIDPQKSNVNLNLLLSRHQQPKTLLRYAAGLDEVRSGKLLLEMEVIPLVLGEEAWNNVLF